jgi:hypothetical protein
MTQILAHWARGMEADKGARGMEADKWAFQAHPEEG